MASSSKTSNYQLNQWAAIDQVLRADFNADNQKIDAAIHAVATALSSAVKLAYGSYKGTSTSGEANPKTLTFSFEPKFVFVFNPSHAWNYCLRAIRGMTEAETYTSVVSSSENKRVTISWSGNSISWWADGNNSSSYMLNNSSSTYYYFAIG